MVTITEILDFAIEREQEAVDFYNEIAAKTDNSEMKKVFEQFAREEMGHKAKLLNIREAGLFNLSSNKIEDLKIADYVVNIEASTDMTYHDALILAMQKEKAAFKLYQELAKRAPNNEVSNIFLSLAQEEAKHKLRFEIEYDEYVLREN
ncbi:MAG: ferritin family protein [Bacteroidales bacterium]|nr:ferritin family protein [Bacteroidales bacterium]